MKLLFGTNNAHKQLEIARHLRTVPSLELLFSKDIPAVEQLDPEETGQTMVENALIKARAFAKKAGMLAAAEDSGLEINALGGKPGVHSKRFFSGSDRDRNQEILRQLAGVTDRSARFIAVISLYHPQKGEIEHFQGVVNGSITRQVEGEQGFGYDPIFMPEGYEQSFAVLGNAVKDTISHRALALDALADYLREHG